MRPSHALTAAVTLALAAALHASAPADDAPTADAVKEKIAALDLDAAKDALATVKAAAKSGEEKAAVKDLEKELAIARKVEPVATKQVPKLAADGKPREAYALAMATCDQFPGALSLPALVAKAREARDAAFHMIDDFDKTGIPEGKLHEGGPVQKPVSVFEVDVTNSTIEVVADPMGGKALRWEWKTLGAGAYAMLGWRWKEPIDLDEYEYATVRYHTSAAFSKPLHVQLSSLPKDGEHREKFSGTPTKTPTWKEIKIAFDKPDKKVDFDPKKTIGFSLSSFQPAPCEIFIDEVLLAKKQKK